MRLFTCLSCQLHEEVVCKGDAVGFYINVMLSRCCPTNDVVWTWTTTPGRLGWHSAREPHPTATFARACSGTTNNREPLILVHRAWSGAQLIHGKDPVFGIHHFFRARVFSTRRELASKLSVKRCDVFESLKGLLFTDGSFRKSQRCFLLFCWWLVMMTANWKGYGTIEGARGSIIVVPSGAFVVHHCIAY